MTRDEAYDELVARLDRDIENYVDYCIGEEPLRKLLAAFKANKLIPEKHADE